MARGPEGMNENLQVYFSWRNGKELKDFVRYIQKRKEGDIYKWTLGRSKINKELKIGSAINQNSGIRDDLQDIETKMREANLLPPDEPILFLKKEHEETEDTSHLIAPASLHVAFSASDRKGHSDLEKENADLHEEREEKSAALMRYELIERFLTDTMRLPR